MVLWSKFRFPVSLRLLKIEVINTYHAKFYIEIPTGRPVILIVKFSFALPPLLDSKTGREPHRELDLVARRGFWRHTLKTTWRAFEWDNETSDFFLSQWLKVHLNCADVFVNIREKTPGNCLDILWLKIMLDRGNFFKQIVLFCTSHRSTEDILLTTSRETQTQELPYNATILMLTFRG